MNPRGIGVRGSALLLTLIALSAIGMLAAAMLLLSRFAGQAAQRGEARVRSTAAADAGLALALRSWGQHRWDTLAIGTGDEAGKGVMAPGVSHTDSISALGAGLFLLRSVGEAVDAGGGRLARSEFGLWVRAARPEFNIQAGLAARGTLLIGGSMAIDGSDLVPPQWGGVCPPAGPADAAVRDSAGAPNLSGPCAGGACLTGAPPVVLDSTVSDSALATFGTVTFGSLVSTAPRLSGPTIVLGPALDPRTGQCDAAVPANMGDPLDSTSACFRYLPIVAVAPGGRLSGGRGQGILLAEGDLDLGDGVEFYGVVVVRGRLRMLGSGSRLTGLVLVRNAPADTSFLTGASGIQRSTCAQERAARYNAAALPIVYRSWMRF
jgi:hypothetical protein